METLEETLGVLSLAYDPDQPRDPHTGEWIKGGASGFAATAAKIDAAIAAKNKAQAKPAPVAASGGEIAVVQNVLDAEKIMAKGDAASVGEIAALDKWASKYNYAHPTSPAGKALAFVKSQTGELDKADEKTQAEKVDEPYPADLTSGNMFAVGVGADDAKDPAYLKGLHDELTAHSQEMAKHPPGSPEWVASAAAINNKFIGTFLKIKQVQLSNELLGAETTEDKLAILAKHEQKGFDNVKMLQKHVASDAAISMTPEQLAKAKKLIEDTKDEIEKLQKIAEKIKAGKVVHGAQEKGEKPKPGTALNQAALDKFAAKHGGSMDPKADFAGVLEKEKLDIPYPSTIAQSVKDKWADKTDEQKLMSVANHLNKLKATALETHGKDSPEFLEAKAKHSAALSAWKNYAKTADKADAKEKVKNQKAQKQVKSLKGGKGGDAGSAASLAAYKTAYDAIKSFDGNHPSSSGGGMDQHGTYIPSPERQAYDALHVNDKIAALKEQIEKGSEDRKKWASGQLKKIEKNLSDLGTSYQEMPFIHDSVAKKHLNTDVGDSETASNIYDYTGGSYGSMNKTFYQENSKPVGTSNNKQYEKMNDHLSKPLGTVNGAPVTLYRGVQNGYGNEYAKRVVKEAKEALATGKPIVSESPWSTSINAPFAHGWGTKKSAGSSDDVSTHFVIHNAKTGVYVGGSKSKGQHPTEWEVVKAARIKYRVIAVHEQNRTGEPTHVIELEELD